MGFPNLAGNHNPDDALRKELEDAGITVHQWPEFMRTNKAEVKTIIVGYLHDRWSFKRAWRYWIAEGPGIPPKYAIELQKSHGSSVRAGGDCACRGPLFWNKGFGTGMYHVDTAEGLKALADTIKQVVKDAEEEYGDLNEEVNEINAMLYRKQ